MVTLERLDELEGRILRALELISDLRSENARLEQDNKQLYQEHDKTKQQLAEKDREVVALKTQLESTSKEFGELKSREEILEKKINEMLSRLTALQNEGGNHSPRPAADAAFTPAAAIVREEVPASAGKADEDESVVYIEDDLPGARSRPADKEDVYEGTLQEDDDIILVDAESDDADDMIAPPSKAGAVVDGVETASPVMMDDKLIEADSDDHLGIFEEGENDDFLIVEDDNNTR